MRFITEFELKEFDRVKLAYIVNEQKGRRISDIGKSIGKAFGFENPVNGNDLYYKLEIEAFPMDKWIEFKKKLFAEIITCYNIDEPVRGEDVLKLIKELESFGKPSGDAIANLPDQMEYRGANSHCRACEDEKAGIKNITAQRHTCKRED